MSRLQVLERKAAEFKLSVRLEGKPLVQYEVAVEKVEYSLKPLLPIDDSVSFALFI